MSTLILTYFCFTAQTCITWEALTFPPYLTSRYTGSVIAWLRSANISTVLTPVIQKQKTFSPSVFNKKLTIQSQAQYPGINVLMQYVLHTPCQNHFLALQAEFC